MVAWGTKHLQHFLVGQAASWAELAEVGSSIVLTHRITHHGSRASWAVCKWSLSWQVRDSAPSAKRSFLEGKGLTAAEIQEAFRRVPGSLQEPAGASPWLLGSSTGSGARLSACFWPSVPKDPGLRYRSQMLLICRYAGDAASPVLARS